MEITLTRIAILKMAFVLVLLAGCAASKSGAAGENALTGKKWRLLELEGSPVAEKAGGNAPYLELSRSENRYVANGGCNNMLGSYTLSGKNGIRFSPAVSTMMACPDMGTERALGAALERIRSYALNGKTLTLQDAQGGTISIFVENGEWRVENGE